MSNGNQAPAEDVKGLVSQTPLQSKIPPNEYIYDRSKCNTNYNAEYDEWQFDDESTTDTETNTNTTPAYTSYNDNYKSQTTTTDSDTDDMPTVIPVQQSRMIPEYKEPETDQEFITYY